MQFYDNLEAELAAAESECLDYDMPPHLVEKAIFAQYVRDPPPPRAIPPPGAKDAVEKDAKGVKSEVSAKDKKETGTGKRGRGRRKADATTQAEEAQGPNHAPKKGQSKKDAATTVSNDEEDHETAAPRSVNSSNALLATEITVPPTSSLLDEKIMPWKSTGYRRTPAGVPLFVSQLSSYPDSVMGACYGGFAGSAPDDMSYLVPLDKINDGNPDVLYGLPGSMHSRYTEQQDTKALQMEIAELEAHIDAEESRNMHIQSEAIDRKHKCDELCTTMALLRSETEGVLMRHNIILETEEARNKSWESLQEGKEDGALVFEGAQEEGEEEEEVHEEDAQEDVEEEEAEDDEHDDDDEDDEDDEHEEEHEESATKSEVGEITVVDAEGSEKKMEANAEDDADADDEVEDGEEDEEDEGLCRACFMSLRGCF
jgi:hypothetical protein